MPTAKEKPKSFTFTLSDEEYNKLMVLAVADGRSMADYLRYQINRRTDDKRKKGRGAPRSS